MKQSRMQGFEADLYLKRQQRKHMENLYFSNLIMELGYNNENVLNRDQALQLAKRLGWSIGRVHTVFDRVRNRYKNNIAAKRKAEKSAKDNISSKRKADKPAKIKIKKRLCVSKPVTDMLENKRSNTDRNRAKRQRKQRKQS